MSRKTCWHCHKPIENINNDLNYLCPHCGGPYCDKPANEGALHILQDKYLMSRNNKDFGNLLLALKHIIYNNICSKLKASGKFLGEEYLDDCVSWSITKIVKLYSNPDFKIRVSFISYIQSLVLFPLYNSKLQDIEQNEISLFTPISNGSGNSSKKENTLYDLMSETPMLDGVASVENYFYKDLEKENIVTTTNDFFMVMIKGIWKKKGFSYALKMLTVLDYFFQGKNNKVMVSWWDNEGLEFKKQFDDILKLYRGAIRNLECV
jgi:hypothetical protein